MEKTTTTKTQWTPNETQKVFLNTLKNANEPLTLNEINFISGLNIKTGSIVSLKTKELYETVDKEVKVSTTKVEHYNGFEVVKTTEKSEIKTAYVITKLGAKLV
jgi:hypothetical protein